MYFLLFENGSGPDGAEECCNQCLPESVNMCMQGIHQAVHSDSLNSKHLS